VEAKGRSFPAVIAGYQRRQVYRASAVSGGHEPDQMPRMKPEGRLRRASNVSDPRHLSSIEDKMQAAPLLVRL